MDKLNVVDSTEVVIVIIIPVHIFPTARHRPLRISGLGLQYSRRPSPDWKLCSNCRLIRDVFQLNETCEIYMLYVYVVISEIVSCHVIP